MLCVLFLPVRLVREPTRLVEGSEFPHEVANLHENHRRAALRLDELVEQLLALVDAPEPVVDLAEEQPVLIGLSARPAGREDMAP